MYSKYCIQYDSNISFFTDCIQSNSYVDSIRRKKFIQSSNIRRNSNVSLARFFFLSRKSFLALTLPFYFSTRTKSGFSRRHAQWKNSRVKMKNKADMKSQQWKTLRRSKITLNNNGSGTINFSVKNDTTNHIFVRPLMANATQKVLPRVVKNDGLVLKCDSTVFRWFTIRIVYSLTEFLNKMPLFIQFFILHFCVCWAYKV